MPLETEVPVLIKHVFLIMIICSAVPLIITGLRSKSKALYWIVAQFIMLLICFFMFFKLIQGEKLFPSAAFSSNKTLMLLIIGISWIISMVFMIIGVTISLKDKREKGEEV